MVKKRRLWVSVLLSILTPGLGQLYNGRPWRSAIFFCLLVFFTTIVSWTNALVSFEGLVALLGTSLLVWLYMLFDTARLSLTGSEYELRWYNRWYYYLGAVLAALVVQQLQPQFGSSYQTFRMRSSSMAPTIMVGDCVVASKVALTRASITRDDIVVFNQEVGGDTIRSIKRVIGLPGETISIRGPKVYIGGKELTEPYATWQEGGIPESDFPETTIPENSYFVLGDNRDHSKDSRFYPDYFIKSEKIIGRPQYIYWSSADRSRIGRRLMGKALRE